jgi:hypothetical protein
MTLRAAASVRPAIGVALSLLEAVAAVALAIVAVLAPWLVPVFVIGSGVLLGAGFLLLFHFSRWMVGNVRRGSVGPAHRPLRRGPGSVVSRRGAPPRRPAQRPEVLRRPLPRRPPRGPAHPGGD